MQPPKTAISVKAALVDFMRGNELEARKIVTPGEVKGFLDVRPVEKKLEHAGCAVVALNRNGRPELDHVARAETLGSRCAAAFDPPPGAAALPLSNPELGSRSLADWFIKSGRLEPRGAAP